ncbi:MAG: cyclic nucleotide-binding domain-containing protein [Deltaproteobacteria bacterium]|nr:cyclic nucleotide-binding domain-containing protein [Kofleriaceae bacterium]
MARRDVRTLRDAAATASGEGKHRKALEYYLELEQLEPASPDWAKRAAETYRRLGKNREAIAAYDRAVDRYTQSGFLVQAIAVCKVILQIDPGHEATKHRLATITQQQDSSKTAVGAIENRHRGGTIHPPTPRPGARVPRPPAPPSQLAPAVSPRPLMSDPALVVAPPLVPEAEISSRPRSGPGRAAYGGGEAAGRQLSEAETADELSLDDLMGPDPGSSLQLDELESTRTRTRTRTGSGPIVIEPGAPLDSVTLADAVPGALAARKADGTASGIMVIPIDDGPRDEELEEGSLPSLEIQSVTVPRDIEIGPELQMESADEPVELDVDDLEDLAEPRPYSVAARRALETTPLFAGLPSAALEQLIERLGLVELTAGQVLFRQGDAGDALYVVAEGTVVVHSEGPPRHELTRFGPGSFFGEVALVTEEPRSATVTAQVDTQLLAVDREAVRMLVADFPDVLPVILRFLRERLVDRLVQTHPLFASFGAGDREYLVAQFKFLEIDPGSVIVREGGRPAGLYAILSGRADVTTAGATVATFGPGDLFGEVSLLTGETSPVAVTAIGRCLALCMPSAAFREIIMTHPQVLSYVGDLADERKRTHGGSARLV